MSKSLNKVILIGNLGADPEVRSTSNGSRVATLSLATSQQWKGSDGQKQEKTQWHRVICWNGKVGQQLADVAEKYCKKGEKLYIEGEIEYRSYQDKDGQTKYSTEIRCRELILLGGEGRQRRWRQQLGRGFPRGSRIDRRCGQERREEGRVVRRLPRCARRRGRRPAVLSRQWSLRRVHGEGPPTIGGPSSAPSRVLPRCPEGTGHRLGGGGAKADTDAEALRPGAMARFVVQIPIFNQP